MKKVERYRYLGSTVTADGNSEQEIRTRLAMARTVKGSFGRRVEGKRDR